MIKSENGELTIDGMAGQLLLDFAHIYRDLIKIQPEIIAATVLRFDDELKDADMDMTMVKSGEMILSDLSDVDEDDNE